MEQGGRRNGERARHISGADEGRRESRLPTVVPYDRTDRHNLAVRRRRPLRPVWWGLLTFVAIEGLLGLPLAALIWNHGGIPPAGGASDEEYFGWTGSPMQGRNQAFVVFVVISLAALAAAVWAAVLSVRQHREILERDARRLAGGVRGVTVPPELDRRRDWFGRRRRRAMAETPLPRAHPHDGRSEHDPHPT